MDILKGLHKEFAWLIWGMVGIGLLWFVMGGEQSETAYQPYIRPAAPLNSGEVYGSRYTKPVDEDVKLDLPQAPADIVRNATLAIRTIFTQPQEIKSAHETSLLPKTLALDGMAGVQAVNPQDEYLRIVVGPDAKDSISLAGTYIRGTAYDVKASLPMAANLPILGTPYLKTTVSLPPEGRALVTSGRPPIGTSFRVNMCTGYINQFQSFTPDLRKDCPEPIKELEATGPYEEATCKAFVKTLPRCETFQGEFPDNVSPICRTFVDQNLNYNSCVGHHEKDKDSYKDEWRLFLDETTELWKDRQEIIRLYDSKGNALDAITY